MGTNYYLHRQICQCCKRYDELHIGKSSMGWTFSFQGYKPSHLTPDEADTRIESYADWLAEIGPDDEIHDEYGEVVPLDKFKELVEWKRTQPNNHTLYCREKHPELECWLDPEGHSFTSRGFS